MLVAAAALAALAAAGVRLTARGAPLTAGGTIPSSAGADPLVTGADLLLAGAPLRAPAPAAARGVIYLPVARVLHPVACAPPEPASAMCEGRGADGWNVVCGGMGRIADMYEAGSGLVAAVGDGAAQLTDGRAGGAGPQWAPQLGSPLGGLSGLALVSTASTLCPDPPCGWAVGERDRIARFRDGCWGEISGGSDTGTDLRAVDLTLADTSQGAGWAVGIAHGEPVPHGALRVLRIEGGEAVWYDSPQNASLLPPLTDVQVVPPTMQSDMEAWAVGASADGRGLFARGREREGSGWLWAPDTWVDGRPAEIAVIDAGATGWAFGPAPDPSMATPALGAWRYDRGTGWRSTSFRLPGRDLVDVYLAPGRGGEPEVWIGASPASETEPLLYRFTKTQEGPDRFGRPPEGLAPTNDRASRAIAALSDGTALYAWGDDVWRLDLSNARWTRVRHRHRLVDLAPAPGGWWLLADAGAGSEILTASGGAMWPSRTEGDAVADLPRLHAIDGRDGEAWAVGDDGVTLHASGPIGEWEWLTGPDPAVGDLLAVALSDGSRVWAAGVGGDGHGRLWRLDGTRWTAIGRTTADVPLRTVLVADGRAWAAGDGVVLSALDSPAGVSADEISLAGSPSIRASAYVGGGFIWAAADHYLVVVPTTRGIPVSFRPLLLADGNQALPFGARLSAIAAFAPDDVWAAYVRAREGVGESRAESGILHFDGMSWRPTTTFGTVARALHTQASEGRRSVWVAGDWSTLLAKEYMPAPGSH